MCGKGSASRTQKQKYFDFVEAPPTFAKCVAKVSNFPKPYTIFKVFLLTSPIGWFQRGFTAPEINRCCSVKMEC